MIDVLRRYARWLHLSWPDGGVEPLPEVREDGSTGVPGVYVAGDLAGVPLLKFALDSGARVAAAIAADPVRRSGGPALDLAIVGAGVAGMAAAIEAKRLGLSFVVLEAAAPFFTIENFPKAKPIFTYPLGFTPKGRDGAVFSARTKVSASSAASTSKYAWDSRTIRSCSASQMSTPVSQATAIRPPAPFHAALPQAPLLN